MGSRSNHRGWTTLLVLGLLGLLGAAVAGRVDGVVRNRLQKALERIREELESH